MIRFASVVLLALAPCARAQSTTAPTAAPLASAADSAVGAREAWTSAITALRRSDLDVARDAVERAGRLWPTQPAYTWGRAVIAARLRDTAGVRRALADYADFGLGRALTDTVFDAVRGAGWFRALEARHDANRAPLERSAPIVALRDSTLWPEGVAYDEPSGRYFVTSVRHRTIVARDSDGSERELWPRRTPGIGAVFSVRVDARHGVLWATTSAIPQMAGFAPSDSALAALLQIDLATGRITRRWALPPERSYILGDLAVAPNGDVLVTDSRNPVLYRLRAGADSLERLTHALFRSLQGVVFDETGQIAYVADYSHGLLRVEFDRALVERLDAPRQVTSVGLDGIAWHARSRSIVAVQNGVAPARVMRFRLDAAGRRIVAAEVLDRNWPPADEPTLGTLIGDEFVYVANSQWEKYTADGARRPGAALRRPLLLRVRVPADRSR